MKATKKIWRAMIRIEDDGDPRPATKAEIARIIRNFGMAGVKVTIIDLDESNVVPKEKK